MQAAARHERAVRRSSEKIRDELGMKRQRLNLANQRDARARTMRVHRMQREHRENVLEENMDENRIVDVMLLLEKRHAVTLRVDDTIATLVDEVLDVGKSLEYKDLLEGLQRNLLTYLHGEAASSPCAAVYLGPTTSGSREAPPKLARVIST